MSIILETSCSRCSTALRCRKLAVILWLHLYVQGSTSCGKDSWIDC